MPQPDLIPMPRWDVRIRNDRGRTFLGWAEHAVELSDTARFIWRAIDGRRTVRQLAEQVAAEYGIDLATAIADTDALLTQLTDHALVSFPAQHRPDA